MAIVGEGHQMLAVTANIPATVTVETHAVLPAAALGPHVHRARIEGEIPAVQVEWLLRGNRQIADRAAVGCGAAVDSVVHAPVEAVEQRLHVQLVGGVAKPAEDNLADIGLVVAVRVLEIDNVGRSRDKDSAVVTDDARGPCQVLCVDGGFIEMPVAIGILQHADPAEVLIATF